MTCDLRRMTKHCARCGKEMSRKGFICGECEEKQSTLSKAMEQIRNVQDWLRAKIVELASLTQPNRKKEPS